MFKLEFVILVICHFYFIQGAKRPSYIIPCNSNEATLNGCAVKNGRIALPHIIKGDNKYKLPNMVPLKIPQISFKTGDLSIQLNQVEILGFDIAQLADMTIDLKKRHITTKISIENATLLSDYVIDGKILIIPINGKGRSKITFVGGIYDYIFDFDLVNKNGEDYLHITKSSLDFTTKRSYYYFENFLTGRQSLGIDINEFLNENWKDVQNDFGPALTHTIDAIMTNSLTGIFSRVPFNLLFIEDS